MKVLEGNDSIESLEALNAVLESAHESQLVDVGSEAVPLTTGDFSQDGSPTAQEIDDAIKASPFAVSKNWVVLDDVVSAVDDALASIVADPQGYTAYENTGYWAYIKMGRYALDDQAVKLLVSAANNLGNARHQTSDARGVPSDANAYIHSGANTLYAFRDDGDHRGYPKVTVVGSGSVSGGQHRFTG